MRSFAKTTRTVAEDAEQRGSAAAGGGGIGAVNSAQVRTGALGPAAVVTLDAPAITKTGSGLMMVTASLSGTDVTPSDTLVVQLARDAAVLLTEVAPVGADAGGTWQASLAFLDTAPDGLAHTYSMSVTSVGTHNLTVAANHGVITVVEQ